MRVLFSGHGARGHVLPLLGLARALIADGHDVLFATAPDLCRVVGSEGIETVAAGIADDAMVADARRRWPETKSLAPSSWAVRMFCEIAAPAMAAALEPIILRWRADVVVREEGEYGSPVAAAAAGLPWITHGWGSPLPGPEALADLSRLVAPVWERAGVRPPSGPELYGAAVLDPCPPSLYATEPGLPHRRVLRPWLPDSGHEHRPSGRRLAYVGFGTVPLFRDPPALLLTVVAALLDLKFDVAVTTGSAAIADDLRALSPERVHVSRWVELGPLLRRCDLVVCHGGAGTVLAALAAGVPLLLLPQGAPSQARMSAACEARGVGRALAVSGGAVAGRLGDALAEVASSDRIRAAAAAVAAEIAAMPDPSAVIPILAGVT